MEDNKGLIVMLFLLVFILFIVPMIFNSCTASEWNDGVCSECDVRYELRGTSKQTKTYVCPECGNEVERYR